MVNLVTASPLQVVCRQLGFVGGLAYGTVNKTFMPSWIMDMNCTGEETSLEQCAKKPLGQPLYIDCKPAYAICYKKGGGVENFNTIFKYLLRDINTTTKGHLLNNI